MLRENDCCAESSESEQSSTLYTKVEIWHWQKTRWTWIGLLLPVCYTIFSFHYPSLKGGKKIKFRSYVLPYWPIQAWYPSFIPVLPPASTRSSSPRAWTSTCSLLVRRDEVVQGNPRHQRPNAILELTQKVNRSLLPSFRPKHVLLPYSHERSCPSSSIS